MPTRSELFFVRSVLIEASQMVRTIAHSKPVPHLQKPGMGAQGLTSLGDFAVQALVAARLEETFPDDILLAEETVQPLLDSGDPLINLAAITRILSPYLPNATDNQVQHWIERGEGRVLGRRTWVLDPIDATSGYIFGSKRFGINLGFMEDGVLQVGGISCPQWEVPDGRFQGATGSLFLAAQGEGAWGMALDSDAPPFRLRPTWHDTLAESTPIRRSSFQEAPSENRPLRSLFENILGSTKPELTTRNPLFFPALALGLGDFIVRLVYPHLKERNLFAWDYAAGVLLAQEVGAMVTDLTGLPLDWLTGAELTNNHGLIAAPPQLHPLLRTACQQSGALEVWTKTA